MLEYAEFLERKTQSGSAYGFPPRFLPEFLFDFQRDLVTWALERGRAAIFADCGLGKGPMALVFAQNVVEHTNKHVLILTPLAVGAQFVTEGEKFGIPCLRSRDGALPGSASIIVSNYEQLHRFRPEDFAGVVCDESGILKRFSGATQAAVTRFMLKMPYRLLGTATAAPNDYIELGTQAEALGEMGYSDMLSRFFKQSDNKSHQQTDIKNWRKEQNDPHHFQKLAYRVSQSIGQWRLKGHAQQPFWRWVASWARACRKPSDLGYDDGAFVLPPLLEHEHIIKPHVVLDGMLFELPAFGLRQEREERRRTLQQRCEYVRELVDHGRQAVVWCHLNPEGDLLEKLIPGAVQVSGKDSDEEKETKFQQFADGRARVMVSKAKVGAWGLNWQFCNHVVTFASHCYAEDTEVLTKEGWKTFGIVSTDDILATVSQETLAFQWQKPSEIFWQHYVGDMLHFSGMRNFDLLVTPNHKMFVQRCPIRYRESGKWELRIAEDLAEHFMRQEYRMMSAPVIDEDLPSFSHVSVPLYGKRYERSRTLAPIPLDDFLRLAGWYLSEGHARPVPGDHAGQIVICQTDQHPEYRAEIMALINRIGLPYSSKTKDIRFNNVDLAHFLIEQLGSGSYHLSIPRWIKDLPSSCLCLLRDTMMKGDGAARRTYYKSFSRQLRDDFQEICLRTGIRASVHNDYVSLAWKNLHPSIHQAPELGHYEGMIGCATVPNHTLIVRRNGIPVVSGNSYEQYYQSVRRCWRFGQQSPVTVDIVATEGEKNIQANMARKARAADIMFSQLVAEMGQAQQIARPEYVAEPIAMPSWL